jgi:hypothetical protein
MTSLADARRLRSHDAATPSVVARPGRRVRCASVLIAPSRPGGFIHSYVRQSHSSYARVRAGLVSHPEHHNMKSLNLANEIDEYDKVRQTSDWIRWNPTRIKFGNANTYRPRGAL